MKILIAAKRVPNPDEPIRIRPDGRDIDASHAVYVLNPFDAIALEEALQIRERREAACEVVVVTIGPDTCENELRTALAMGADRAIRIDCGEPIDSWNVAKLLVALVRREAPDLILMGKQAIDDDANQAGQMLAGLLDWPQATFASRVRILDASNLEVSRETDLGIETIQLCLPAVITADLRLNQPRYASLPALMKVRKRPIEAISQEQLGVSIEPRVWITRLELSTVERKCTRVSDVAELVHKLRYEAKVI